MVCKFKRLAQKLSHISNIDIDSIYFFLCEVAKNKKTRNFEIEKVAPGQIIVDRKNKLEELNIRKYKKMAGANWCDHGGVDYEDLILQRQEKYYSD